LILLIRVDVWIAASSRTSLQYSSGLEAFDSRNPSRVLQCSRDVEVEVEVEVEIEIEIEL
jgi:hypothetical protein